MEHPIHTLLVVNPDTPHVFKLRMNQSVHERLVPDGGAVVLERDPDFFYDLGYKCVAKEDCAGHSVWTWVKPAPRGRPKKAN